LALGVPSLHGQATADETPRVESVVFEGVSGLDEKLLTDSLATQETRCRGFLLKPFCAFSDASAFVEKHDLDPAELTRDELRIRVIYFRKGWREARVASEVTPEGDGVRVTFTVDEGPLTTVAGRRVTQTEPILSEGRIADAGIPEEGEALDLLRLDSARTGITNALWDLGYGDAEVRDSLVIDSTTHTATLEVVIEPGPPTTIGEVAIEGNERVSDYTVTRLLDLPPGSPYRRSDLNAAQRRLFETELFRQSVVRVAGSDFPRGEPDPVKELTVSVREAPLRSVRIGGGLNTIEYVQSEARFVRYNFLGGARRLDLRVAVGNLFAESLEGRSIFEEIPPPIPGGADEQAFLEPTWQAGVELTQPFFITNRTSLGVGASVHRRSLPGIVIDRGVGANASVTHRIQDGIPVSVTYRFERVDVEAGELYFCANFGVCDPFTIEALAQPHQLSPVMLLGRIERTDDPLAPNVGFQARVELEHASRATMSDFMYQRAAGEASRYFPIGRSSVLAARVRAGWVRALDGTAEALGVPQGEVEILHPRRRFLAGGSRSVRGYAENQLGPRVLTIPAHELTAPTDTTDTPACTTASIVDLSCDPNAARSEHFTPRPLGGNTLL
jgi:outer membrane protein assembly factor BamA